MRVLSIDPPVAWAWMSEREVFAHGRIPLRKDITAAWVDRWIDVVNEHHADAVGIEAVKRHKYGDDAPYIRDAKADGAIVLARRAGILEGVCRCYQTGVPIEIVETGDWRATSGLKESWGRDRLKAASVALVKQLYKLDVSHDEADAILIGRHLAIDIPARERGRR